MYATCIEGLKNSIGIQIVSNGNRRKEKAICYIPH